MDEEARIDGELHFSETMDEQVHSRDQFAGAFFSKAQHFVVAGGNFKSVTKITQVTPDLPSDFRRIPMGDLDLCSEIRIDSGSGLVRSYPVRRSVRRVYSARVEGFKSKMTVTLYQGENAEEEWWKDVSRYSGLRHPNLVQLFGTARSSGIHATIFRDELIPAQKIINEYSNSHFKAVFLWNVLELEFMNADKYIKSVSGKGVDSGDCTMWIRPSTGRLCVDPTANDHDIIELYYIYRGARFSSSLSILEPPEDTKILDSISLERYHEICYWHFDHHRQLPISTNVSVQLGVVIFCPPGSEIEHPNKIAYIPDLDVLDHGWSASTGASLTVLENGWTRVDSSKVSAGYIYRSINLQDKYKHWSAWLVQANHVFHRLGISSNQGDYVLVDEISYRMRFATGNSIPLGYLFLCPLADLQVVSPSRFRLPECPAYWSFDPTGDERLSMEDAERLGFPNLEFEMKVDGWSWENSVYNGIRQFQEAKGFDPYGQDVARKLGLPLYEISAELNGPFAHIQEIEVCDDRPETQEAQDSELPQELFHGLHFLTLPPVASTSGTAHRMNNSGAHSQGLL